MARVTERSAKERESDPAAHGAPIAEVPSPAARASSAARLSVPFDEDKGTIDFSSMRESTRAKLRRALADPSARAALGGDVPPSAGAESAAVDPTIVMLLGTLYDMLSSLAVVGARSRGFSDRSAELMRFTEAEKAALLPPTIKVLSKYDLLGGKYADEIALVLTLGGVVASKVMEMRRLDAAIDVTPAATAEAAS